MNAYKNAKIFFKSLIFSNNQNIFPKITFMQFTNNTYNRHLTHKENYINQINQNNKVYKDMYSP